MLREGGALAAGSTPEGCFVLSDPELQAFFQKEPLVERGKALRADYGSAEPFPHVVLDGFLPEKLVRAAAVSVAPIDETWLDRDRDTAKKRGIRDETRMEPALQALLYKLNSGAFLEFLEALTGIEGLLPDPYFQGGGIHQIERGGFLKVHADFNIHKRLGLDRRLNLLLYLNDGWNESWGGELELWDQRMTCCVQKLAPILNRCVIFSTTDTSFHGHPEPLECPEGQTRKSLAVYYYTTAVATADRTGFHPTLYQQPSVSPQPVGGAPSFRAWLARLWARLRR